ncbi:MAG: HDIG domain-containing protein, partial [Bacteroidales bacterium]|nr:HDIG domain-containing protein [Bacteroidales bacterium]
MKKIILFFKKHHSDILKGSLFLLTIVLLVLIFPREGKFKYEFQKGKPWKHKDLIAPFDFAIIKPGKEIELERLLVLEELKPFFKIDDRLIEEKTEELSNEFEREWKRKYSRKDKRKNLKNNSKDACLEIFNKLIITGIIELTPEIENKTDDFTIIILKDNIAEEKNLSQVFSIHTANEFILEQLRDYKNVDRALLLSILEKFLIPNIFYDAETTEKEKQILLNNISLTHGMVQTGERIISKGELVTGNKYQVLESIKMEYEQQLGSPSTYYSILIGQIILISISVIVLLFFLLYFRKDIYADNKKLILILLVIILMVFITSLVIKFNVGYLYLVPICLVPIVIRAFFDTRLALYVHIITIIIIGFLVPNSFEFVFLQLIAGIIVIISVVHLQKRSQFFVTSFMIFLTYITVYVGLTLIQEGSLMGVELKYLALFAGSAVLTLFSYPLIFIFEKIFGMITDVTLMELSNSNTKLLRELSMKAPGTFQHSLQVANLAEEALYEIGGNTLLARTGALYHDIGKMDMPEYFVENQSTGVNPHDDLPFDESAKIIISHVRKGVKKAKKHNLPEQIIVFIKTHHGTRKVMYFYNMLLKEKPDEQIDEAIYTYPGPIPFSKESAVLMMADSVEAASRSIKQPNEQNLSELVDNIINKQVENEQFVNSNITLREITKIKNILKKKLMNMYHVRIEYP